MSRLDDIVSEKLAELLNAEEDLFVQALIDEDEPSDFAYSDGITTHIHETIADTSNINEEERSAIIEYSGEIEDVAREMPVERGETLDNKLDLWAAIALDREVGDKVQGYFERIKDTYSEDLEYFNDLKNPWLEKLAQHKNDGHETLLDLAGVDLESLGDEFESYQPGLVARYTLSRHDDYKKSSSEIAVADSILARAEKLDRFVALKSEIKKQAASVIENIDDNHPGSYLPGIHSLEEFRELKEDLRNEYDASTDEALLATSSALKEESKAKRRFLEGLGSDDSEALCGVIHGDILPVVENMLSTGNTDILNIRDANDITLLSHLALKGSGRFGREGRAEDILLLLHVMAAETSVNNYRQDDIAMPLALFLMNHDKDLAAFAAEVFIDDPNAPLTLPNKLEDNFADELNSVRGLTFFNIAGLAGIREGDFSAFRALHRKGGELVPDSDLLVLRGLVRHRPNDLNDDDFVFDVIKQHIDAGVESDDLIKIVDGCTNESMRSRLMAAIVSEGQQPTKAASRKTKAKI